MFSKSKNNEKAGYEKTVALHMREAAIARP